MLHASKIAIVAGFVVLGCSGSERGEHHAAQPAAAAAAPAHRCTPAMPCWPSDAEWKQLAARLAGTLEPAPLPLAPCAADATGSACTAALAAATNPYALQDQPGGTESLGWLDAWTATPSAYAVAARSTSDIVAAVQFARAHDLRVVIKGTGHDYLGRSSAPDSLLIWTHAMRDIDVADAFVPRGCTDGRAAVPAVTLGAGVRWLEAYDAVVTGHHRFVQGGGCTSVGAAGGFLQGGGFGSWSKKYGIAAASLLEAEVVTASGEVVVANACQHADLLWALRGGGGGTFGVVTKVTLMTHPLPATAGVAFGEIHAGSDASFLALLEHFAALYVQSLGTEAWGEQVHIRGDNTLEIAMTFQGLTADDAKRAWQPLRSWAETQPGMTVKLDALAVPAEQLWNRDVLLRVGVITLDDRGGPDPGASGDHPRPLWWWKNDAEQVATFWHAYQSWWIPLRLVQDAHAFARAMFDASRSWSVGLHFNKGQAGAAADALARDRDTSMNPAVLDAAALAIVAASSHGVPGMRGHEPDATAGRAEAARVTAAVAVLRAAAPGAGSYVNETDYFERDWQRSFWGDHYARLLAIKHAYDPDNFFTCHHCVGSE